ncbi:TasA family protein [Caproiciproducens sp. CPB-2]|uniref:TasA family protein n=1 Tax=unclassified Caproiciproducens TaxID=2643836 RepID=UPI0023DCDF77|nr:TasA family protein [Caproiciproducens sp. CPB-2]MDF1493275.1 TasA family protein [Caproiciproducens sp. CPB-2]
MNFKTKVLTSVLAVGLTVALIGGSTMAWFTDSKEVKGATFQAGTVTLSEDSGKLVISGFDKENINPGDGFNASLNIVYTGTKPVKLRIKVPEISWLAADGETALSTDNVDYGWDAIKSNWRRDGDYIYYIGSTTYTGTDGIEHTLTDGILPGIKDDDNGTTKYFGAAAEAARTIHFSLDGLFNGAETDNQYQGAKFTLGDSSVEVIQATNSAAWPATGTVPPAIAPAA